MESPGTLTQDGKRQAMEKKGDHIAYQLAVDTWRIRNGLEPMYSKGDDE